MIKCFLFRQLLLSLLMPCLVIGISYAVPYPVLAQDASCKQDVINAYEHLSQQAAALAQKSAPTVYRLLAETYYRPYGQKQEKKVARTITMATQRGNTYYTDGANEVYSNSKERVVIDRQQRTILIIDSQGDSDTKNSYAGSINMIRTQLLANAQLSSCTEQQIIGKKYRKVVFKMPASVQTRTRITTLESLLTTQGALYQTGLVFSETEAVRRVRFTVLASTSPPADAKPVAAPLSYVYRSDHQVQIAFTGYRILDQRKNAH